jgi:hypothetical protein
MARALRIQYPGAYYHVMNRGNRREDILIADQDRKIFLKRRIKYLSPFYFHFIFLKQAEAQLEEKYRVQVSVIKLSALIDKVAHCYRIDPETLWSASKEQPSIF